MELPRDETQDAPSADHYDPESALLDAGGEESFFNDVDATGKKSSDLLDSSYSDCELKTKSPAVPSDIIHTMSSDSEQAADTPTREIQKSAAAMSISRSEIPDTIPKGMAAIPEKNSAESKKIPDISLKNIPASKLTLSSLMKKKKEKEIPVSLTEVPIPSETYKSIMNARKTKEKVPALGDSEVQINTECGSFYNAGDGRVARCHLTEDVASLTVSSLSFDSKNLMCLSCPKTHSILGGGGGGGGGL